MIEDLREGGPLPGEGLRSAETGLVVQKVLEEYQGPFPRI